MEHLTATEVPGYERVEVASAGLEFSLIVDCASRTMCRAAAWQRRALTTLLSVP